MVGAINLGAEGLACAVPACLPVNTALRRGTDGKSLLCLPLYLPVFTDPGPHLSETKTRYFGKSIKGKQPQTQPLQNPSLKGRGVSIVL